MGGLRPRMSAFGLVNCGVRTTASHDSPGFRQGKWTRVSIERDQLIFAPLEVFVPKGDEVAGARCLDQLGIYPARRRAHRDSDDARGTW
jgi:hypothetical protein